MSEPSKINASTISCQMYYVFRDLTRYDGASKNERYIPMENCTQYQQRIRECFAQAFRFFDNHKHARTDADWERVTTDLAAFKDPPTVDLVISVVKELEREYNASGVQIT